MAEVTRIGHGAYRVESDGRQQIVYIAGSEGDLWAWCDGEVYREQDASPDSADRSRARRPKGGHHVLTSPMPATVVKVLATAGQVVRQGDTLVVVEAMKMELPIRAPASATIKAVNCREGEMVQPDRALVEFE